MTDDLQFDSTSGEYPDATAETACSACDKPVRDTYFTANGAMVCPECRLEMLSSAPTGTALGRLSKAIGFGLVGGAIGAAVYFLIVKLTGYEVGLVAILVGFLVGAGVKLGSAGRGGFGYQALAVGLTYLAIVSSYVPLMIDEMNSEMALDTQSLALDAEIPKISILASGAVRLDGAEVSIEQLRSHLESIAETTWAACYYREGMDAGEPPPIAEEVAGLLEEYGMDRVVFTDAEFTEPLLIGEGLVASDGLSVVAMLGILLILAAVSPFLGLPENLIGLAIIGLAPALCLSRPPLAAAHASSAPK
jgi:hypothetical protein